METFLFDKILYKYRDFDSLKKILETGTLNFNCPSQFNDPFEFSPSLLSLTFSKAFIKESLKKNQDISRKEKRRLINIANEKNYSQGMLQSLLKRRDYYGVFCGSEINDSVLMWSHYADNHKGFCFGLKFPRTIEFWDSFMKKEGIIPMYVNYVNEIIPAPCELNGQLLPNDTVRYWFSTKSKVWEYEKEIRLIRYKGKGFVSFPAVLITEVYFGLLTPAEQIREIISLLIQKGYSVSNFFKMEFEDRTFNIIAKPYKII